MTEHECHEKWIDILMGEVGKLHGKCLGLAVLIFVLVVMMAYFVVQQNGIIADQARKINELEMDVSVLMFKAGIKKPDKSAYPR